MLESKGHPLPLLPDTDEIIVLFFQLTANGGRGKHGRPALKDVMVACRPQPGLLLSKPRKEGVPVLGSSRGPKTAMNHHVQVSMIGSKGQPLLSKKQCIPCL